MKVLHDHDSFPPVHSHTNGQFQDYASCGFHIITRELLLEYAFHQFPLQGKAVAKCVYMIYMYNAAIERYTVLHTNSLLTLLCQ